MPIIDGTQDALDALEEAANRAGKPFDLRHVYRRGCADDGGQSGRLVLVDDDGKPVCDENGRELAVPWCTTGEVVPTFHNLDR